MIEPNYNDEISEIVGEFRRATEKVRAEMALFDVTNITSTGTKPILLRIGEILRDLLAKASDLVARLFSRAATDGITRAMSEMGVPGEPKQSRTNSAMLKAAVDDTQADLLAVTQNIDRRTKTAIRQAVADSMRANMSAGVNGRKTINRDTLVAIRKALGSAADTGIIDAAGRRWKPEVYVDMVTRTKALQVQKDAVINEALERGVQYGVISKHGAKDACANWEGRVVKLSPDAPGNYPYIGDLPRRDIFHPNCRHTVVPRRNPERNPSV